MINALMDYRLAFWLAIYALDLYAIYRAITRRRSVEATLAWVFAIIALPAAGAVFYLLLVNPSVRRTSRRKRVSAKSLRRAIGREGQASFTPDTPEISILRLAAAATGLMPTSGNSVLLLAENEQAFSNIGEALRAAKKSIWAEYYLIRNDETGHRFLEILAAKAREGLEVRLLYDAVGSMGLDAARLRAIEAAGGKVEAFLPLNPLRRRWSVHLRNHRKMIIVDGEIGFTGGMNVGNEYSGRFRRRGDRIFHDTHLALRGPAVGELAQIFAEDWTFATEEPLKPTPAPPPVAGDSSLVAVVPSGPDQEHNANALVYFSGIASARERVYLASPYFVPDDATQKALISAAMRGVDVRVLVPAKSDTALVRAAARSYYPALVRGGVRVYEYLPTMLHAKTMMVDNRWGMVGSANLDVRSFGLNFELGALVADPGFAEKLNQSFQKDLQDSREITLTALSRPSYRNRLINSLARLLSPLL